MNKNLILIGLIGVLMSGCGDKKDAIKDNFENSINAHYENECISIGRVYGAFPVQVANDNEEDKELFAALAKVGLVTSKPARVEDRSMTGFDIMTGKRKIIDGFEYKLTDLGTKSVKTEKSNGFYGGSNEFCAGKYKVSSIENFTEPSDISGYKLTRVNFKKVAIDVPEWANDLVKEKAFEQYAEKISKEPIDEKMELVLTDNGWIPSRDLK